MLLSYICFSAGTARVVDDPAPAEVEWADVSIPTVDVAAIDNGLAFPFKHPDEWRACKWLFFSGSWALEEKAFLSRLKFELDVNKSRNSKKKFN